ncbi:unnamed protein product, partial [Ectocarpus fasciculatus]
LIKDRPWTRVSPPVTPVTHFAHFCLSSTRATFRLLITRPPQLPHGASRLVGDVQAWSGEKPGVLLRPCFVRVRGQWSNDYGMHDTDYTPTPQSTVSDGNPLPQALLTPLIPRVTL